MPLSKILPIDDDSSFNIPAYQRNYSWKIEQIDQLFSDILDEEKGYYIGNLLVTGGGDNYSYDVIDGQQRLTTLSLFLLAIWEAAEVWCTPTENGDGDAQPRVSQKEIKDIGQIQEDIRRRLLVDADLKRPRIHLLDTDQEIFAELLKVIEEDGMTVSNPPRNRSFTKRYEYIKSVFVDIERFPNFESLKDFYKKLIGILILQIKVGNLGDAFTVFSSLNSKGLPLTLVDLLKGEFLGAAVRLHQEKKGDVLATWDELSSLFTRKNGDSDISVTTQFLLNNFDAFESESASPTTKGKALGQYQAIIREKYRVNVDYLQELIDHGRIFAQMIQIYDYPNDSINRLLIDLGKLESTQAYPFILRVLAERDLFGLNETQIEQLLNFLIAFYVRRNITLIPKASNIRSRMLGFIQTIRRENLRGAALLHLVIDGLKEMSVTDEQLINSISNDGMYNKNTKTTRFILISLERFLSSQLNSSIFDKGQPDNFDEYRDNGKPWWTIEHILPEGPLTPYWSRVVSPNDPEHAEDEADRYKHMLGNLTLTPYNADLGQLPFTDREEPFNGENTYKKSKRDFTDKGHFVGLRQNMSINDSIPDTNHGEAIENKMEWTTGDIVRRTSYFAERILDIFNFGASSVYSPKGRVATSTRE
jgi:uncharacterized protein with ParB-like and HNH nuclease domain